MQNILINPARSVGTISPNIYGHFSEHLGRCIYDGLYVGDDPDIPNVNGMRTAAVEALKRAKIPVLRWPGGCFADTYHWMDGIGPKESRKTIVNTFWGGVTENNSFGTHEFLELCRQLGCQPYISGNVGSGTVQEFSDWIEYCNMPGVSPMASLRRKNGREEPWNVVYWGIGNETWGCGGNMTAEHYADVCKNFSTYMRGYGGPALYKIASGANGSDYHWTKVLAEKAGHCVDALSLHYYTGPSRHKGRTGSASVFGPEDYYDCVSRTLFMDELIENHTRIMRNVRSNKKLGLVVDEWGLWFDVEPGTNPAFLYQQSTMRDAVVAALNLNIFNNHCDGVVMANIAQTVNVLQSLILTEGAEIVETPTLKVFELFAPHQGAKQLDSYAEAGLVGTGDDIVPDIQVSASENADGEIFVTAVNADISASKEVVIRIGGIKPESAEAKSVWGDSITDKNDFGQPEKVFIRPLGACVEDGAVKAVLPAGSVTSFTVRAK